VSLFWLGASEIAFDSGRIVCRRELGQARRLSIARSVPERSLCSSPIPLARSASPLFA
jgi:hypothetical protein